MTLNLKRWFGMAGIVSFCVVPVAFGAECPAQPNHHFPGLPDGKPQSLCQYQGKVILVVNSAGSKPGWNFHKYLINRDATQVLPFDSATRPDDKVLLKKIDEFLK